MNKKKIIMIAAALLLVGSIAVKPAMAYFTDTHTASGVVKFGHYEITPHEEVHGMTKTITVENTGDYPVYVRVKVIAGSTVKLSMNSSSSTNWSKNDDGYYYYSEKLVPSKESEQLWIDIDASGETLDSINVIVVEEASKVGTDGKATWDATTSNTDIVTTNEGGAN